MSDIKDTFVPICPRSVITRTCPHCRQPMKVEVGLHNWKNLFKWPTFEDWITLIMIALVIASYYAYKHDTQACRNTLNNIDEICRQKSIYVVPNYTDTTNLYNLSTFITTNTTTNDEVNVNASNKTT